MKDRIFRPRVPVPDPVRPRRWGAQVSAPDFNKIRWAYAQSPWLRTEQDFADLAMVERVMGYDATRYLLEIAQAALTATRDDELEELWSRAPRTHLYMNLLPDGREALVRLIGRRAVCAWLGLPNSRTVATPARDAAVTPASGGSQSQRVPGDARKSSVTATASYETTPAAESATGDDMSRDGNERKPGDSTRVSELDAPARLAVPGKRSLTEALASPPVAPATPAPAVQMRSGQDVHPSVVCDVATLDAPRPTLQRLFGGPETRSGHGARDEAVVHAAAARGVATSASPLPHGDAVQRSFGSHDISGIHAHTGPEAAASVAAMGAKAYATGDHVVLGNKTDLHTVAHEAAHAMQQRAGVQLKGSVGVAGDAYEGHADTVADAVVAGKSAEALLDRTPGGGGQHVVIQRSPSPPGPQASRPQPSAQPSVMHYSDMLAAVQAAKSLSDRAKPDDPAAHAQILALLEPVEHRLDELNDHQGRLAQFGAGNIAGQTALDTSEAAIRSWRQRLLLGATVHTDELVLRFRMGAEVLQFLTGEQRDAPTLREFNHVSGLVGIGAGAAVLTPALVALAAEEVPLLAFAGRISAQRVAFWAIAHPAAALASSEVLLGFGLQIGEGGWESFWDQLHDPQGRWFILAQVLTDYVHVRGSLAGHNESATASPRRSAPVGTNLDVEAARQRIAQARAALHRVSDAVEAEPAVPGRSVPRQADRKDRTTSGTEKGSRLGQAAAEQVEEAQHARSWVSESKKTSQELFIEGADPASIRGKRIKPGHLRRELMKSEVGKETLEIIERDDVNVILSYNAPTLEKSGEKLYGISYDDHAVIYVTRTQSTQKTAQTVIHEVTHNAGVKGTQRAEIVAEIRATKHLGPISSADIRKIILRIKKDYPDLPYEITTKKGDSK